MIERKKENERVWISKKKKERKNIRKKERIKKTERGWMENEKGN